MTTEQWSGSKLYGCGCSIRYTSASGEDEAVCSDRECTRKLLYLTVSGIRFTNPEGDRSWWKEGRQYLRVTMKNNYPKIW